MTIGQSMLEEFDQEMATTRRLLERVPDEHAQWKPHPKSFSLGHLAQLVSWMPGWIANAALQPSLDLAGGVKYSYEPVARLVADFDKNVSQARAALESVTDEELRKPWSLTMGDKPLWTAPRVAVLRNHISHLVHHRGQLSVYLRLRDVPLPPIYGPTADASWNG